MQTIIAIVLIGAGGLWLLVQNGAKFLPKLKAVTTATTVEKTFAPAEAAPVGTYEYLKMIESEAPKGAEKEWWAYACQGLSPIAVARSERDRLGGGL